MGEQLAGQQRTETPRVQQSFVLAAAQGPKRPNETRARNHLGNDKGRCGRSPPLDLAAEGAAAGNTTSTGGCQWCLMVPLGKK